MVRIDGVFRSLLLAEGMGKSKNSFDTLPNVGQLKQSILADQKLKPQTVPETAPHCAPLLDHLRGRDSQGNVCCALVPIARS